METKTIELLTAPKTITLAKVLTVSGLAASAFEAKRFIEGCAVRVNGTTWTNPEVIFLTGADLIITIGKRRTKRVFVT